MKPFKTLLLGTALSLATFTAAQAADPKVSEIDVSVQFSSVDANALDFYPNLEADLESALAKSVEPMMAGDGGRLLVIIYDLGVDGNAILNTAADINTLHGGVQFYPPNPDKSSNASAVNPKVTDIKVVAVPELPATMDPEAPDYLILPSDGTVYEVMVDKFAEVVAERLPEL